jgi:uncharacterized membrane protein
MSGCSSILDSPYSQIGPAPLSALGVLAFGSVAFLSFCSIALKQQDEQASLANVWLPRAQQGILYGTYGTVICLSVDAGHAMPVVSGLLHCVMLGLCCAGSSILAGTSIALALTLKMKFPGQFCAYCAASIVASLTLYFVSFAKLQDSRKNLSFGSVMATTLLITGLFATYPDTVTASALPQLHEATHKRPVASR